MPRLWTQRPASGDGGRTEKIPAWVRVRANVVKGTLPPVDHQAMTGGEPSDRGGVGFVAPLKICVRPVKLARPFGQGAPRLLAALASALGLAMFSGAASAQTSLNPVYVDDSATAAGALGRIPELVRAGNRDAAANQVNELLTREAERLVPSTDAAVFVTVRRRCHELLLADPALLERYRATYAPTAEELARQGQTEVLERSYFLTPPGMNAALDLAQLRLEGAAFDAALLTLRSLEGHPDLAGPARERAGALLVELSRYLSSPPLASLAKRWGVAPAADLVPWPTDAKRIGIGPTDPGPALEDPATLAKSLWTVPLGAGPSVPVTRLVGVVPDERERESAATEPAPLFARALRNFPVVADDLIYVFDGVGVAAWDRFTLTRRWRTVLASADLEMDLGAEDMPRIPGRGRGLRGVTPDPNTVTVRGMLLGTASGTVADDPTREPLPATVHLLNALTGRRLWSRRISDLDPTLADTVVRGPVMIDQGLLMFAARRTSPARRLVSVYLAGVDIATGELKWRRLLGSAGILPFRNSNETLDGAALADGVIYRADQLGVIGAVEAHSGRPLWVRRFEVPTTPSTETTGSYQLALPILDAEGMITLSPTHQEILRLDRATGAVLARRAIEPIGMGAAHYLVPVGRRLAIVGPTRIATLPLDGFDNTDTPARLSPLFETGILGRVTASGDDMLVPLRQGMCAVNAVAPDAPLHRLPLEAVGNVVPTGAQVVMVDDARLHNFLAWEPALATLTQRLETDPADATAAVTLTELAYRSGRHESIVPMLDRAQAALKAGAGQPRNELARRRLFEAVISMLHASLEPAGETQAARPAPGSEPGADVRIADAALLEQLLGTAATLATVPDERVAVMLVRGRSLERAGNASAAATEYQAVLADPALAAATWSGPRLTIRADVEATWRIDRLIAEQGPAVYAGFDAQAAAELATLLSDPAPEAIQSLMDRFPMALAVPRAATALADTLEKRGRGAQAVRALESGLRAALRRADQDPAQVGALVQRLATSLEAREDVAAAVAVVRDAQARIPTLTLPGSPAPTPIADRLTQLQARYRQTHRWPQIGQMRTDGARVYPGWIVMTPDVHTAEPTTARCVAMENGEEISLWRVEPGPSGEPALKPSWTMPFEDRRIELLAITGEAAIFYSSSPSRGSTLMRVSAATGPVWTSPTISSLFASAPVPGDPEEPIVTPLDGAVRAAEPLYALDERTAVIVDRAGRAAAFDLQSGQTLWFLGTPIVRVFDVSVRDGVVLISGEQPSVTAGGATIGLGPAVMVLDARSGRQLQRIADPPSPVYWSLLTDNRQIIVGVQTGLVSYDASTGRRNWEISMPGLGGSAGAWVFGNQGFVIGEDRALWYIDLDRAQTAQRLDTPMGMFDDRKPYRAGRIPAGVAFSSWEGIVIFNDRGEKVGEDGLNEGDDSLPAAFAEGLLVTADHGVEGQSDDGLLPINIRAFDTTSAKLVQNLVVRLGANPRRVVVVDGLVVLTAGHITITLPASP